MNLNKKIEKTILRRNKWKKPKPYIQSIESRMEQIDRILYNIRKKAKRHQEERIAEAVNQQIEPLCIAYKIGPIVDELRSCEAADIIEEITAQVLEEERTDDYWIF